MRLPTPGELKRAHPPPPLVGESRRLVRESLAGGPRRLAIVGPCSIHDEGEVLSYARKLAAFQERVRERLLIVMRAYVEKPRSTTGWKGFVYDPLLDGRGDAALGLRASRRLLARLAALLPVATEFVNPLVATYLGDLVSWVAIGARTCESQPHREVAASLSCPVGVKNPTCGDAEPAADSILAIRAPHAFLSINEDGVACRREARGNPDAHLVLRGGRLKPNYDEEYVAIASYYLRKRGLPERLLIDCSHANSRKRAAAQARVLRDVLGQALRDERIRGFMLESYLGGGRQSLPAELAGFDKRSLKPGVSVTDECLSWRETERLLLLAAARL